MIKKQQENEEELTNAIKSQEHDLNNLKQKLQMSPALLSLEYVDDQLERKLNDLKECLLTAMEKKEDINVKSYAEVTKYKETSKPRTLKETHIKIARKQEDSKERENKRRSSNLMIYGVSEEITKESDREWVTNLINKLHNQITKKNEFQA